MGEDRRLVSALEASGKLSRSLEFIPEDEQLAERSARGEGLTRAELAILISYSKADLKETLADSDVPDDEYLGEELHTAFPATLVERHEDALAGHRLRREIIATQLANDMVNHMGVTFQRRLEQSTGATPGEIARAYVVARDVFRLTYHFGTIEALDHQVPASVQFDLMDDLMRLGRRATRWFIRNRRLDLRAGDEVAHFKPRIAALAEQFDSLFEGPKRGVWETRYNSYLSAGVPEQIARMIAATSLFYSMLGIIEAADATGQPTERVARVSFVLGSELQIPWFGQLISNLQVDNHWQALARESYRDDLDGLLRTMTVSALQTSSEESEVDEVVENWIERNEQLLVRWRTMLTDLKSATTGDYPMISVAMRELLDLAQGANNQTG